MNVSKIAESRLLIINVILLNLESTYDAIPLRPTVSRCWQCREPCSSHHNEIHCSSPESGDGRTSMYIRSVWVVVKDGARKGHWVQREQWWSIKSGEPKARSERWGKESGGKESGGSLSKFNSFVASLTKLTSYNTGL